jgi:hypothetical protein
MVNDSGQLYTIEGVAAGILMIVTAYLVISTTTVLTPQDVHIIDMQLQQLGSDALAMMDTPDQYGSAIGRDYSPLTLFVMTNNTTDFRNLFLFYVNNTTNIAGTGYDRLNYTATIFYENTTNEINKTPFGGGTYYRENAVTLTRWVYLPPFNKTGTGYPNDMFDAENQTVLLEVLLWRE